MADGNQRGALRYHLSGSGAVVMAAALWGTVGPAKVFSGLSVDSAALGAARLLLGGFGLAAFAGRNFWSLQVFEARRLPWLLTGAVSTAVFQVAFLSAVGRSGAAVATVVTLGTAPIATGAVARWWMGEKTTGAWIGGTALAVAGLVLLSSPRSADVSYSGLLLSVIGGSCYGIYTVAMKKIAVFTPDVSIREIGAYVAVTLLAGGLVLLPWLILGITDFEEWRAFGLVVWLGLGATTAAYLLFVLGLQRVTAATAGTLSLAEPLATAFLSWAWLHESLPAVTILGATAMLAGILTSSVRLGTRRPTAPVSL